MGAMHVSGPAVDGIFFALTIGVFLAAHVLGTCVISAFADHKSAKENRKVRLEFFSGEKSVYKR